LQVASGSGRVGPLSRDSGATRRRGARAAA
jgi:hypothetical protein